MLGAVGDDTVCTDLSHVNESWRATDCSQDALVVAFENQSDGGEDVEKRKQTLARDISPNLKTHSDYWFARKRGEG